VLEVDEPGDGGDGLVALALIVERHEADLAAAHAAGLVHLVDGHLGAVVRLDPEGRGLARHGAVLTHDDLAGLGARTAAAVAGASVLIAVAFVPVLAAGGGEAEPQGKEEDSRVVPHVFSPAGGRSRTIAEVVASVAMLERVLSEWPSPRGLGLLLLVALATRGLVLRAVRGARP
jgi:hypothetical protein